MCRWLLILILHYDYAMYDLPSSASLLARVSPTTLMAHALLDGFVYSDRVA